MRMKEKHVTLTDGTAAVLKSVGENEADAVLAFMNKVHSETDYLAETPQEIAAINKKQQQEIILGYDKGKRSIMLAAYVNSKIAAYLVINAPEYEKESHRASFSVAVLKEYQNKGAGSALLSTGVDFAGKVGYEQMEADTVTENVNALLLLQKFGFEAAGKFPRAVKCGEVYRDYIRFVKVL